MEIRIGGVYVTKDGRRARVTEQRIEKRGTGSSAIETKFWVGAVIGAGRNEWTLGGIDRFGIAEWDLVEEYSLARKSA